MRALACLALVLWCPAATFGQTRAPREDIVNFSRVDATVACGGAVQTLALAALQADGFRTIVNFRFADEKGANVQQQMTEAADLGLKYVHLPFTSSKPDPKVADQFLATVADPANHPVFVHCSTGGRAGTMWMIKRVLVDGYTIERATEEARAIGMRSAPLEKFAMDYIASHKAPSTAPPAPAAASSIATSDAPSPAR